MRVTRSFIPNLFTLANLFSGFTAIIYISQGDYNKAAAFILFAAIFDMLDGIVARLFKATSELGAELDSLCDAVSFGVAPSYMLYHLYFSQIGEIGILISSLPALAGVVRLARFNVMVVDFEDKDYFTGMPIPAAALTIISYIIFIHLKHDVSLYMKEILVYIVTFTTAAVMVSNIKFDNLPRPTKKSFKKRPIAAIVFIIAVVGSIATWGKLVFPFMVFYIIASSIRHFIVWIKETREAADDFDESEDFDRSQYDL
ncbi:CDP-diacylglycerol--serine O-phosphatidyltransferase [Bacteroidota bacterium]